MLLYAESKVFQRMIGLATGSKERSYEDKNNWYLERDLGRLFKNCIHQNKNRKRQNTKINEVSFLNQSIDIHKIHIL